MGGIIRSSAPFTQGNGHATLRAVTTDFDPSGAASANSGIFGLPHSAEQARVLVLPLPFDATTSYRAGAANGPQCVLEASHQIDLFDLLFGRPYEAGIHMLPPDSRIAEWNARARREVESLRDGDAGSVATVDELGARLNELAREATLRALDAGKLPVALGGDHATAFGPIAACAERHHGLGVLQFDAHADLRVAYEGFRWSHASVSHNVLQETDVARLVQVGVRDLCEEEFDAIRASEGRVHTLFDTDWTRARNSGADLRPLVRDTLAKLPDEVYVTFDVDGLDPTLCPNTGTPVPGGLDWHGAMLWLEELAASGKRIVGLDLNEVNPGPSEAPDGVDAIVGARLLYRLIGTALASS